MQSDQGVPAFGSFTARVVTYDDIPDQCTIYPADVDDDRRATTWITAEEGSYRSLESYR